MCSLEGNKSIMPKNAKNLERRKSMPKAEQEAVVKGIKKVIRKEQSQRLNNKIIAKEASRGPVPLKKKTNSGIGKSIGGLLGVAAGMLPGVGPLLAGPVGMLGSMAGDAVENLIFKGKGSYVVEKNSYMSPDGGITVSASNGWVSVKTEEYIGEVFSSSTAGGYSKTDFQINPGLHRSFPWMSIIARAYSQWRPEGLLAVGVSQTSSTSIGATSTAIGMWGGAVEYDVTRQNPYPSYILAKQAEKSVFVKASENFILPVECKSDERVMVNGYNMRTTSFASSNDYVPTDLCVITIGSIGLGFASQDIGSLYFFAHFSFAKKTMNFSSRSVPAAQFVFQNSPAESVTNLAPFGVGQSNPGNNTLDLTVLGTDITFPAHTPPGDYDVRYYVPAMNGVGAAVTYTVGTVNVSFPNGGASIATNSYRLNGTGVPPYVVAANTANVFLGTDGNLNIADASPNSLCLYMRVRYTGTTASGAPTILRMDFTTAQPWFASLAAALEVTAVNQNVGWSLPLSYDRVTPTGLSLGLLMEQLLATETRQECARAIDNIRTFVQNTRIEEVMTNDLLLSLCPTDAHRDKLAEFNFGKKRHDDVENRLEILERILNQQNAVDLIDHEPSLRAALLRMQAGKIQPNQFQTYKRFDPETGEDVFVDPRVDEKDEEILRLERKLRRLSAEQLRQTSVSAGPKRPMSYASTTSLADLAEASHALYQGARQPPGAQLLTTEEFDATIRRPE
jgi:hypothetical protein